MLSLFGGQFSISWEERVVAWNCVQPWIVMITEVSPPQVTTRAPPATAGVGTV